MKKLLLLFFLSLVLTSVSYAEKYSCAYMFDDEARPASFERSGNYFYVQKRKVPILFENENAIFLATTDASSEPPIGSMIVIDKNKLNFVLSVLEFENSSAIIEGNCRVFQ